MLENTETKVVEEEVENPNEVVEKDNSKIQFPISGIVVIGVLIVCIAICIIVINVLGNK